jgi:SAM-dependent methyltransferase
MDLLRHRAKLLEAVEVDPTLAATLQRRFAGANVNVRCGNATNMPYDDGLFSAVVSFTMLHHIPSPELQDHFFREAHRVLQSGGVFIGVDSLPSLLMRLVHLGDTLTLVSPDSSISVLNLPDSQSPTLRLAQAGSGAPRSALLDPESKGHIP